MTRMSMVSRAQAAVFAICVAGAVALPSAAAAQSSAAASWRLAAAVGAYVPRSAMIVADAGRDTQLGAGPSISLEVHFLAADWAAIYGGGLAAFSAVALGANLDPPMAGSSDQVTLLAFTGGVVLALPTGTNLEPTLRLGGGIKGYSFDLDAAEGQWRPTGDFGVGLRGLGSGPIEVSVEGRYLPSSFDQAKLPTRGITPQEQRQTDLLFVVGVSIRP